MAVTAGLSRWEPAFKMICTEKEDVHRQAMGVCLSSAGCRSFQVRQRALLVHSVRWLV